jgi:hypothetical protein
MEDVAASVDVKQMIISMRGLISHDFSNVLVGEKKLDVSECTWIGKLTEGHSYRPSTCKSTSVKAPGINGCRA